MKTTSNEDNLQWNTTYNGRRPPMKDDVRWKITSNYQKWNISATAYFYIYYNMCIIVYYSIVCLSKLIDSFPFCLGWEYHCKCPIDSTKFVALYNWNNLTRKAEFTSGALLERLVKRRIYAWRKKKAFLTGAGHFISKSCNESKCFIE